MPTFREDVKLGTKVPLIKKDDIDDFIVTDAEIKDGSITKEKLAETVLDSKNIKHDGNFSPSHNVHDAIEDVANSKFDKSNVLQERGESKEGVMSQKAVTEEINRVVRMIFDTPFSLSIESSNGIMFSSAMIGKTDDNGNYLPFTTLSVKAYWYNKEVTGEMYNVKWTRESDFPEEDEIWNKSHSDITNNISLTLLDLGGANYNVGNVFFRCEAEYNADSVVRQASVVLNL